MKEIVRSSLLHLRQLQIDCPLDFPPCEIEACETHICIALKCNDFQCDDDDCTALSCDNYLIVDIITCPADLPDLVPVEMNPLFCTLDDRGRLIVTVKNQGTAHATPTVTRVLFSNTVTPGRAVCDLFTPGLDPGEQVDLRPVTIPPVTTTDINFKIIVNFNELVPESNTENNTVSGRCVG